MNAPSLIRMGLGALRHRATGRPAPLNAMIALTSRCNSRCAYCDIWTHEQAEMSTDALLSLIDQLAARGTRRVGFWGGEPLVRTDIAQLIARCRQRGIWVTLDTNGYLFPARWRSVQQASHVVFSLDGRAEAHDANRERGAHARVMRALQCARERRFSYWTLTVLTRHNLGEIDALLSLAERMGHRAAFQVLHHTEGLDGGKGACLLPSDAEYRAALGQIIAYKKAGRPVANSLSALRLLQSWPSYAQPTSPRPFPGVPCLAGELYVNIEADGTVMPCSLVGGRGAWANANEVGLDAALAAAGKRPCESCSATAFTEYNLLFGLNPRPMVEWVRGLMG